MITYLQVLPKHFMLAHELSEQALDQFATVMCGLPSLRLQRGLKLFLRGRQRLLEELWQNDWKTFAAVL